jgi:hypothetical protein
MTEQLDGLRAGCSRRFQWGCDANKFLAGKIEINVGRVFH